MEELIEWSVRAEPIEGKNVSGDSYLVEYTAEGVLIGVVDALGHGQEAYEVATLAIQTIQNYLSEPLQIVFQKTHEKLQTTRGVVMSLAFIHYYNATLTWLGVGNIEGLLLSDSASQRSPTHSFLIHSGVVGHRAPPSMKPSVIHLTKGDLLIIHTDGIDPKFIESISIGYSPQIVCNLIMRSYSKGNDDALVFAARYKTARGASI